MDDLLLYDADCGFCTRCAHWIKAHAPVLRVEPLHAVDCDALGVDEERSLREVPFRHGDGHVTWGSAAIADALARCDGPWRYLGQVLRLPLVQVPARPVYRAVARHRHEFPGGTAACRIPDSGGQR